MESTEKWLPVVGYEGIYEVSDRGRVWSVPRQRSDGRFSVGGKFIALTPHPAGHLLARLVNGDRGKAHYVHKLVAAAFIGTCPDGLEVCHDNDDPTDNRVENLSYGTRSKNMHDRVRNGKHHAVEKTHCPRGHLLAMPNLVASMQSRGHRACLACNRARAIYRKRPYIDLQQLSDEKYVAIMRDAA